MVKPEELKQFREDFEKARAGMETALLGLKAEDDERVAKETIKRTRLTLLEVGRALHRMHSTGSWRDQYKSWSAVCRKLNLPKSSSHRLMNNAAIVDNLPHQIVEGVPEGLSHRQMQTLKIADEKEIEEVATEAEETGDARSALDRLRESLASAPETEIDDEAPAQPKQANGLSWVKRLCTSLMNWFEARGVGEQARPHIEALIQLAAGPWE